MRDEYRYQLIAVDLDGTLLNSQHELPPENRAALHRAHEAGIKIVLCTGRSFPETEPVIRDIGLDLDATVTVGGAVLTEVATGRTIDRTLIPIETARLATDWLRRMGYAVLWLTDRNDTGFDGYAINGPRRHKAFDRWLELTPCMITQVDQVPRSGLAPLRLTVVDDSAALGDLSERLSRAFAGRLTHNVIQAPRYEITVIEAFAPQVSKWYGVEKLCRRWGIDPIATVALGDDVNDVELVRRAGLGVAMANAHPMVKEVALRMTDTNDNCGVARLIDILLEARVA